MDKPGFRNRLWRRRYRNQPHLRHHNPYLPPLNQYRQPGQGPAFRNHRHSPRYQLYRLLSHLLNPWHLPLLNHSSPVVGKLYLWALRLLRFLRRPP